MVVRPLNSTDEIQRAKPSIMSSQSSYAEHGQARALQSDVASLHLPPHRVPTPEPSDHEDSNSDWDASEREDESEQVKKGKARAAPSSQPHHAAYTPPAGPPPGKPAPLNVAFNGPDHPEDELVSSPWADNDTSQSALASKSTNNPFRRPTDYTPAETVSKHTSVWSALESGSQETHILTPQSALNSNPVSLSAPSASVQATLPRQFSPDLDENLIDVEPSNPWDDDQFKKGEVTTAPGAISGNPWDDASRRSKAALLNSESAYTVEARTGIEQLALEDSHTIDRHAVQALSSGKLASPAITQRNEIYPVKRIRWYDIRSGKSPRESPILIQNANGPCPLLALVNALSLSTPPDLQTELIRTLSSREQVSLGLLIDAVFEELMSGRQGSNAQELPDISQLYSFLVTLHTGMNVNPCFTESQTTGLGAFETTKEMTLYSTFAVPLIHGWIPSHDDNARASFARSAPSYEEAQNMQFREEEIESKLGTREITPQEQSILMDLTEIKHFFNQWPTQLTQYGLQSMQTVLQPGSISILFRNDHFSTLYKEPKTNQLMTLVTDAGYANHDEIVWESLVDISGTSAAMFSGDFRCVSHDAASAAQHGAEWTTFQAKPNRKPVGASPTRPSESQHASTSRPAHARNQSEQEDHDLALALQLQEEEDQRHRSEQAARRRENELSQQYISGDTPEQRPQIPPRRNNRPATNRPAAEEDPELPSYEQAAASRPYRPQDQQRSDVGSAFQEHASQQRVAGRPSTGATPFDNGRRGHRTEYEAIQERREGCSIM